MATEKSKAELLQQEPEYSVADSMYDDEVQRGSIVSESVRADIPGSVIDPVGGHFPAPSTVGQESSSSKKSLRPPHPPAMILKSTSPGARNVYLALTCVGLFFSCAGAIMHLVYNGELMRQANIMYLSWPSMFVDVFVLFASGVQLWSLIVGIKRYEFLFNALHASAFAMAADEISTLVFRMSGDSCEPVSCFYTKLGVAGLGSVLLGEFLQIVASYLIKRAYFEDRAIFCYSAKIPKYVYFLSFAGIFTITGTSFVISWAGESYRLSDGSFNASQMNNLYFSFFLMMSLTTFGLFISLIDFVLFALHRPVVVALHCINIYFAYVCCVKSTIAKSEYCGRTTISSSSPPSISRFARTPCVYLDIGMAGSILVLFGEILLAIVTSKLLIVYVFNEIRTLPGDHPVFRHKASRWIFDHKVQIGLYYTGSVLSLCGAVIYLVYYGDLFSNVYSNANSSQDYFFGFFAGAFIFVFGIMAILSPNIRRALGEDRVVATLVKTPGKKGSQGYAAKNSENAGATDNESSSAHQDATSTSHLSESNTDNSGPPKQLVISDGYQHEPVHLAFHIIGVCLALYLLVYVVELRSNFCDYDADGQIAQHLNDIGFSIANVGDFSYMKSSSGCNYNLAGVVGASAMLAGEYILVIATSSIPRIL
eukprot:Nk52_evm8s377 gene=Nk52_evmTU8s377